MGSLRQFTALLHKNFILQTRSRKTVLGIGGWGGLLLQVLVPAAFFVLMCIPKHYIKPIPHPQSLTSEEHDLDSRWWAGPYSGPALNPENAGRAHLILAPDSEPVRQLAMVLSRGLACPSSVVKRSCPIFIPSSFHCMFIARDDNATARCQDASVCMGDTSCYGHLLESSRETELPQVAVVADEAAALQHVLTHPHTVDAVVVFDSTTGGGTVNLSQYTIRMNQSDLPPTRFLLDLFDVYPSPQNALMFWRQYWFFVNLQHQLDQSIIGLTMGNAQRANARARRPALDRVPQASWPAGAVLRGRSGDVQRDPSQLVTPHTASSTAATFDDAVTPNDDRPASVAVKVKPFPWPAKTEDLGAAFAAAFLNLLLVYAFLAPTRAMVASVVREKELRLREGMRILGLSDLSYWSSWALTHWCTLAASGVVCTLIGTYPFARSSIVIMLAFFGLLSAALVAFSYFLSTLFTSSRVAGTAAQSLYALSMIPGFVLPTVQPYGGSSWYLACLSPPSAASLFAQTLVSWELSADGITWHTFWLPTTQANGFCVASIFGLLMLDVLLYGVLAWYLDQVLPQAVGVRRPFWFPLLPSYWSHAMLLPHRSTVAKRRSNHQLADAPASSTALFGGGSGASGRSALAGNGAGAAGVSAQEASNGDAAAAVRVRRLRKVFPMTSGGQKVALDDVDVDFERGRITALLGHNGAGKTTLINILTGMLEPTSGTATLRGYDVRYGLDAIRHSLGVCPQFDILWPDLTVAEHLQVYAAIKGISSAGAVSECKSAADEVGLGERLDVLAGDLSGGQRRKLSVAIAFLGRPAVVFLDEPTSGMDPYSRRFTWDVIRSHRQDTAIVLTTHSMEEADILADTITVMNDGRVAASGTAMELKGRYGLGYTLTLVLSQPHDQPSTDVSVVSAASSSHLAALDSRDSALDTLGLSSSEQQQQCEQHLLEQVSGCVPGAELLSAAGAELCFRLPRDQSGQFASLLRFLEAERGRLGVDSYGLSVTTLEEVFLRITQQAAAEAAAAEGQASPAQRGMEALAGPGGDGSLSSLPLASRPARGSFFKRPALAPSLRLRGWRLYVHQVRALFIKRALCARRDRLAVLTQLVVPLLLVYIALWVASLSVSSADEPSLALTRWAVMFGRPTAFGADAPLREGNSSVLLSALVDAYGPGELQDGGASRLWRGGAVDSTTLEGQLLGNWSSGHPVYSAVFLEGLARPCRPNASIAPAALGTVQYALLVNQSAISAMPAALSQANSAVLRFLRDTHACDSSTAVGLGLGANAAAAATAATQAANSVELLEGVKAIGAATASGGGFSVTNFPLPLLRSEPAARVSESAGGLMLVLCMTMASSVLSASFVVFLVREQDNNSKHVQMVSGAGVLAFWLANLLWDVVNFSIPAAGIVLLVASKHMAQFSGERLTALAALLWVFGFAGLALTYLMHFIFKDEMKALQRLNTAYFLVGYLGFLITWITDLIIALLHPAGLLRWNQAAKWLFRTFSPHYCFGKGLYDISQTSPDALPIPGQPHPPGGLSPWPVFRQAAKPLIIQAVVYSAAVLLLDSGLLQAVASRVKGVLLSLLRCWRPTGGRGGSTGSSPYHALPATTSDDVELGASHQRRAALEEEDEDVERERLAVQGGERDGAQVLLDGIVKRYSQGFLRPPTVAVDGLWLGVPCGQCFGLLGVNGAGKTTTFRTLTGEVVPNEGDALICGVSVVKYPWAARRRLGYCPQFEALPGAMTGREVLHMYARLRGVPDSHVKRLASHLLSRLGLTRHADNVCSAYSGGNKRKLSVAVSLVGDPPVVLLDEPSTGMDPAARHCLWSLLQREVMAAGRTVVLTSHSMEECEALCTLVGIMVAGRLRCFGTVQHLKGRFGSGYALELKTDTPDQAEAVSQYVSSLCPAALLTEQDGQRFVYCIPRGGAELAELFDALERRPPTLGITDYSVAQATLEQVFIAMASGGGA